MQTLRPQHVPVAHTQPSWQSDVDEQSGRGAQLSLGPQKPVPSAVAKQKQSPSPQLLRLLQVDPAQLGTEHWPLRQTPEGHWWRGKVSGRILEVVDAMRRTRVGGGRGLEGKDFLTELPQEPQLLGSVRRFSHEAPQRVSPAGQAETVTVAVTVVVVVGVATVMVVAVTPQQEQALL
jgi:hypothetical protein